MFAYFKFCIRFTMSNLNSVKHLINVHMYVRQWTYAVLRSTYNGVVSFISFILFYCLLNQ